MQNYMSMYSGISGQAHASAYCNTNAKQKSRKLSIFDSLQDSISLHRNNVNNHYGKII